MSDEPRSGELRIGEFLGVWAVLFAVVAVIGLVASCVGAMAR